MASLTHKCVQACPVLTFCPIALPARWLVMDPGDSNILELVQHPKRVQ